MRSLQAFRRLPRLLRRARPVPTPLAWHSVSSTREYERCPRRYRWGYLERRPQDRPAPPTWRFGSVVHEGLEAAYRMAMTDPASTPAHRRAAAGTAVRASWRRHQLGRRRRADRDWAVWLATRALAQDVIGTAGAHILGVELRFRDTSDERVRVAGVADLVLERDDGTLEIVDHKVTSWHADPEQLSDDFQLNLYGELARRTWPHVQRVIATHHYPTGPRKVSVELTPERMAAAYERVRTTAARIRADMVFAPTPSSSCDHCPWLPSCSDGRRFLADAPASSPSQAAVPHTRRSTDYGTSALQVVTRSAAAGRAAAPHRPSR